jgi:GTP-binding protein YchF
MNVTLFGYPKTGKTTLFNVLSGARVDPSATEGRRDAREHVSAVPDGRLDRLAALYPDRRKIAAAIDFIDLAGISYGEVKTGTFLNALRKADILVHVVRGFRDDQIPHAKPSIDPAGDVRAMEDELLLADLLSIEQRLEKLDKDLKKAKSPEGEKEQHLLLRLKLHAEGGVPLRAFAWTEAEEKVVRAFAFLSQKPILHLLNADESDIPRLADVEKALAAAVPGAAVLAACGRIEGEIQEIDDPAEKAVFLAEYGLTEPTSFRFFRSAVGLMNLVFFYTVGKDEVRAWPLRRHSSALRAAGAIHTDIEKGFIRAEVVTSDDLFRHGSWQAAKDKGALRLEGRDYIVQDGDVIYFRFAP